MHFFRFRPFQYPLLAAAVLLSACNSADPPAAADGPDTSEEPKDGETSPANEVAPAEADQVSILRPEVDPAGQTASAMLEELAVRVPFPVGGNTIGPTAEAALQRIITSEQFKTDAPIILRAHSDASGDDDANLTASRRRGESVRDWLVEQGVPEDRITVIAFGEQNPVEPNALPDGTPNELGRAVNRRVDVTITPPKPPANKAQPQAEGATPTPAQQRR